MLVSIVFRQATMVEVVIYMTENTPNGLEITLFARRTGEGVFNAQAVLDAVEVSIICLLFC